MIIKLCAKCKKIIEYPNRYCKECEEKVEEQKKKNEILSNRRYNKARDKKYIRFYKSPEWNLLKNKKLQDTEYKCERCGSLATEVHHIKFIQNDDGWELRLDYNNLKSVCLDCHNFYHKRFQKRKR